MSSETKKPPYRERKGQARRARGRMSLYRYMLRKAKHEAWLKQQGETK